MFILVCLALKRVVEVSPVMIHALQPHLAIVPYVQEPMGYKKHLNLLAEMNLLMIDDNPLEIFCRPGNPNEKKPGKPGVVPEYPRPHINNQR